MPSIPEDSSQPEEGGRIAASEEVSGDSLVVHIEGTDRLWAIKSRLEIPLANVVSAAAAGAEARLAAQDPGRGSACSRGALGGAVLLPRAAGVLGCA